MKTKLLFSFFICLVTLANVYAQVEIALCDNDQNGTESFDLTAVITEFLNGQNPNDFAATFHVNLTHAQNNTNAFPNPTAYVNVFNPQQIWLRLTHLTTNDFSIHQFSISALPIPFPFVFETTGCDENNDGFALFDLEAAINLIYLLNNVDVNSNTLAASFYENEVDMLNQVNALGTTFTNTMANQSIWLRLENTLTGCAWTGPFALLVDACEEPSCETPTNLSILNSSEINAVLSWESNNQNAQYEVYVTLANAPGPNLTEQGLLTTSNTYTLVGLSCNTSYTFYVRSICGTLTSAWSVGSTFQTQSCGSSLVDFVTINTNSLTTEQIINNVLLNSSCGIVDNVFTFGQCGVGYFENNNSDFPFEQGLIIRSGNVQLSQGPFTGNQNQQTSTCTMASDPDLVQIMNSSGVTGTINDVSYVKFDIIPSTNVLSFNFIFASNEYGTFQCNFSDVFGFILTDLVTNEKINIAVVPGTNIPISTTTIRDNAHNTGCISVNPEFFSTFHNIPNQGVINMKGYTVPMTAIASVIPNHPYSLKLAVGDYQDNAYDSAVFIQGGSLALGDQCRENIQIIAFLDENNNGIKDNDEVAFLNGNLNYQLTGSTESTSLTSWNGNYYIFPDNTEDSFDFQFSIFPEYANFYATPIAFENISYSDSESNVYFIPIVNTTPYTDVSVSLLSLNPPTAGFSYINKIVYTNHGVAPASGTLSFTHDAALSILSVSEMVNSTVNGFTFDYENLMPSETRMITLNLQVPPIPIVTIGDSVTNQAQITSNGTEATISNNQSSLTRIIVASYDPNDKHEAKGPEVVLADFTDEDYLYYTIRFQNTGTTNATFVRIEDELDAKLNSESLRMIAASHPYTLERVNQQLIWHFNNIQLVPQLVDEEASIGFVHFKIKPNQGIQVGDIIPNYASIYFDFNPVIVTNTFETTFVELLSTPELTAADVMVFPNPATHQVHIVSRGNNQITGIRITDMLGKIIKQHASIHTSSYQLTIDDMEKGMYLIEITLDSQVKLTQKLVKK